MTADTARNVLSFITDLARQEIHSSIGVNLFGGEPLLAPRAVYTLARGLQDLNGEKLKTKVSMMLSTNGTLYDQEIYAIFAERPELSTVVVSLDAFKEVHDRNRPFHSRSGKSTYDVITANLDRMKREEVPFSIVCVVPYPYDYIGASRELHRRGFSRLEIKRLIRHVYGKSELSDVFQDDFDTWRRQYLAYSDFYIDYLKGDRPARHVDRYAVIADYARAMNSHRPFHRVLACGVADEKIAITTEGKIMPCESFLGHDSFVLGDVLKGYDPEKFRKFEEWILSRGQLRTDRKRCRECFAKRLCGGGCYAMSYDKTGSLNPLHRTFCRHIREMVKIDLYYISRVREQHPEIYRKVTGA
jgi:uncharacterized protein